VLRRWRRQPFEVAFKIGVIDLAKRIGASLICARRAVVELAAYVRGRHLDLRDYQCVHTT
jgi:hypothetical protein